MDSNMSAFKRRFNRAMLELGNSQASNTARRLVGQTIQAMEKRRKPRHHHHHHHQQQQQQHHHHHQLGAAASNSSGQPHQRRQFRYTFAPSQPTKAAAAAAPHNGGTWQPNRARFDCQEPLDSGEQQQRRRPAGQLAEAGEPQDHGRPAADSKKVAGTVKYRQYYEISEADSFNWSLVNELTARRQNKPNQDDDDDDYFDVEYLATKEKTMLPNNNNNTDDTNDHHDNDENVETIIMPATSVGTESKSCCAGPEGKPFARSSHVRTSVRSMRRRSAKLRQVRFQPIPQSIDISNRTEEDDNEMVEEEARRQAKAASSSYKPKHLKRRVTRKLNNLSHMNVQLNKITLKGFNNLAHRFQQTINRSATQFEPGQASSGAATATVHSKRQQESENEDNEDDDDIGWGSDFDDQSADSSLTICNQSEQQQQQQLTQQIAGTGGYLLEIGKASSDTNAINDVIHGQGISGQFKRLDTSSDQLPPEEEAAADAAAIVIIQRADERPSPSVGSESGNSGCGDDDDDDDEDEEAELRSLEERQGFKHIRDKLKIIFDQRLMATGGAASAAAIAIEKPTQTATTSSGGGVGGSSSGNSNNSANSTQATDERPTSAEKTKTSAAVAPLEHHHEAPEKMMHSQAAAAAAACGHLKRQTNNNNGEFDCQSHCSDDSNHSGSQDSGHSTQHSAYSSTNLACLNRHLCAQSQVCGGSSSGAGDHDEQRQLNESPAASLVGSTTGDKTSGDDDDQQQQHHHHHQQQDDEERRSRFKQNRLIINNKLESMFRSRSGGLDRTTPDRVYPTTSVDNNRSPTKQSAGCVLIPSTKVQSVAALAAGPPAIAAAAAPTDGQPKPESRHELLEQQRQMSLKLKQKPRRKAAAARPRNSPSGATERHHQHNHQHEDNSSYVRPAVSLRQLVKDVIDDCERPGELPSLSRSNSLSSDSAPEDQKSRLFTGDEAANNSSSLSSIEDHESDNRVTTTTTTTITTLRAAPAAPSSHHPVAGSSSSGVGSSSSNSSSCMTINFVSQSPVKSLPQLLLHQPQNYYLHQQQPADQSLSSVGSIDGLEYEQSSILSTTADISLLALHGSPTMATGGCDTSRANPLRSYLKSLRDFSRSKLKPKVKLIAGSSAAPASSSRSSSNNIISSSGGGGSTDANTYSPVVKAAISSADIIGSSCNYQPEGSSTIAGTWRRKLRRPSIAGYLSRQSASTTSTPLKAAAYQATSAVSTTTATTNTVSNGGQLTNHFVTISNRKWKSCHLRGNLMQITASDSSLGSINSGMLTISKHNLGYLDNSKNFTDE